MSLFEQHVSVSAHVAGCAPRQLGGMGRGVLQQRKRKRAVEAIAVAARASHVRKLCGQCLMWCGSKGTRRRQTGTLLRNTGSS